MSHYDHQEGSEEWTPRKQALGQSQSLRSMLKNKQQKDRVVFSNIEGAVSKQATYARERAAWSREVQNMSQHTQKRKGEPPASMQAHALLDSDRC
jgi:hypothetical protein